VSARSEHAADCIRCAEHIANHLKSIGMTKAEVMKTDGHPVVYAEWLGAPGKPTVLLYGHYDVQPIDPENLWKSPPFEPTIRDGNLYARGACDDKGQVYMHVSAIQGLMKVNGGLPVNLKMVIEGEEESGSDNLEPFLTKHRAMLDADVIVVSDTGMMGPDQPALTYGLRGMLYTQVEVTGPSDDLHSGHFGGAVMNPANAIANIIAALHDADRHITVPGFYDRVQPLSDAEREVLRNSPFDEKGYLAAAGLKEGVGEKGYTTVERKGARPTLDVNGIWGGYIGEGAKTVIPSVAKAKISMRLVPDQDPEQLFPLFETYVKKLAPAGVTVNVINLHGATPWAMDPNHPMLQCARRALARAWTKPPGMIREGGSIPVMATFDRTHGLPAILMGFGLDDDNLHAPNEKFALSSFHGGTRSVAYLYEEIAKGA
jgi:acetylornithine deacetylase/succinyl-diaminopimelate desuccinylase-like protein